MINSQQIKEIDFTFKCKIATYDEQALTDVHRFISDTMKQRLKDIVGQHGVVSCAETTMER